MEHDLYADINCPICGNDDLILGQPFWTRNKEHDLETVEVCTGCGSSRVIEIKVVASHAHPFEKGD